MVTLVQLLDEIYDELVSVVSTHTSVSTPDDHVGVLNRTEDIEIPFFGFEWTQNPVSHGFGGNSRVVDETWNNDTLQTVERARDYELIVDFGVIIEGDFPRRRDEYLGYIQSHFADFVDGTRELHADVTDFDDDGANPASGGDSRDVGFRATFIIEYMDRDTIDVDAAETVDWNVDLDDDSGSTDAYPENYG